MQQWSDLCIEGYKVNRESTVRQARTHIHQIVDEFGDMPLSVLRPSQVKTWVARLQAEGLSQNYVYSLHSRLSQIMSDAVHDGVLGRNPCSRRTAPPMGNFRLDDRAVMATGGPIEADSRCSAAPARTAEARGAAPCCGCTPSARPVRDRTSGARPSGTANTADR